MEYCEYDSTKLIKALNDISKNTKNLHRKNIEPILVAQSNGGFFGQLISQKHGLSTILINPSLRPSTCTIKHDLTQDQLSDYDTLQSKLMFGKSSWPKHIILSSEDEIVDPNYTKKMFSDFCKTTIMAGETHKLSNKGVQLVIDNIHAINNHMVI